MADRVGQQLGNYHLTRLLGKGGFGEVYQAEHRLLDRQQAIKVLLEQHFDDPRFLERFMREAKTLAKLDHPNIVHVDELGMEGNLVYLVMPFISGGTLQQVLKSRAGPLALNETERYLEQICAALDYAHTRGVVHLDLKPLNLLVHEDGRLLLSDFGLAHLMKEGALQGGTSLSFGTPLYMAPEHLRGQPDRRSDLYALGVMLYQMLTGRLPFAGSTPEAVMIGHLTEPPPPLLSANPALPPTLDPVLSRALAKKPDERYQTAGELVAALKAGFSGRASQPLAGPSADAFAPTRYSQPVLDPTIRATNPPGVPLAPTQGQVPPVLHVVSQPSIHPGKIALVYRGQSEAVYTLAWSPDGRSIASGGGKYESKVGGSVQVFDALTGRLVANYRKHAGLVMSLSWSPDQQYLASASFDKTVHVWGALYENTILIYRPHSGGVSGVAWSPDGQRIVSCASGSSDQAQVWNPLTSALLLSYKGHSNSVVAVAWSPDGTRIASGSWDQTVQVWDAQRGNTLVNYRGHLSKGDEKTNFIRALAWSPDGTYLASSHATDARVHIWDARTGRLALMYKGHSGPISALAWSPNGRYLASGSQDRTVQLCDPTTGAQLFIYRGHTDGVRSVVWSPDGRYVASAGMDKTVQVWQVG